MRYCDVASWLRSMRDNSTRHLCLEEAEALSIAIAHYESLDQSDLLEAEQPEDQEARGVDELRPGDHWLTTQLLGSGWAAVEMWLNNEHEDGLPTFPEPYETGIGRYTTEALAAREAKQWAKDDDLPYIARRTA